VTGANGIATVGSWTLATLAGSNTLTATAAGLPDVQFSATGTAGAADRYLVTSTSYLVTPGNVVTITAQLADVHGNAVATAGKTVIWTSMGGGSLSKIWTSMGGGSLSNSSVTTNANGVATVDLQVASTVNTTHAVTVNDGAHSGTSPHIVTKSDGGGGVLI
jgi:adhesin/invasin